MIVWAEKCSRTASLNLQTCESHTTCAILTLSLQLPPMDLGVAASRYTLGISSEEYVHFLWKLFWRIARGSPPHGCVWKDDSEIFFQPMYEDDATSEPARPGSASCPTPKCKAAKGRKGNATRKLTRELSIESRLLQPTASSRASRNTRSGVPAADNSTKTSVARTIPERRRKANWHRPTQVDEEGLAAAMMRRASLTTPGGVTPMHSRSLRSSMRRQSLAIDARVDAAMADAAVKHSSARRASLLFTDTISITATAVKHLTLRALQSRNGERRVGPEPLSTASHKVQRKYKPAPHPCDVSQLHVGSQHPAARTVCPRSATGAKPSFDGASAAYW